MPAESNFAIIAGQPVSRRTVLRTAAVVTGLGAVPAIGTQNAFAATAAIPSVWVHGAADRMFPTTGVGSVGAIALAAAKGEHEAAQVMVRSGSDVSGVRLSVGALAGPGGATIAAAQVTIRSQYLHRTVGQMGHEHPDNEVGPGNSTVYYDALMDNASVTVPANSTQPFHVGVRVPANQPPGLYTGTITVASNSGNATVPISVRVYDVTLPAPNQGALKINNWFTSVGWDYTGTLQSVPLQYGCSMYDDRWWTVMANFAKNHARHRNNVIYADFQALLIPNTSIDANGNYSFGWQTFDRFIKLFVDAGAMQYIYTPTILEWYNTKPNPATDDVAVNCEILQKVNGSVQKVLVPPNSAAANAYLDKVLPALKAHLDEMGWTDKFYFSALDEPRSYIQTDAARWLYSKYAKYFPNPRTAEAHNYHLPDLEAIITTSAPFTSLYHANIAAYQRLRNAPGKELWLYTCIEPQDGFMNRFLSHHLDKTRLIPWLLWKIGAGGYLHWGWNYWVNGDPTNGFTPADTFDGWQNGDAWLVRPNRAALDVYDSIRSEAQLDGIEDYELLTALAKTKPATAYAIANRLITDAVNYTRNGEDVVAAHKHLLDALVSPAADARFPVTDGFADERNWTHVAGSWSISGGTYSQTDSSANWGYTSALKARGYGDFAATVDVQITAVNANGGDTNWAGLMVRSCNASEMDTGYLVALRRNGELFVYRCGETRGRVQVPGFSAGAPTRLKVVAQGSTLTICAGPAASPILTVDDSYFRTGNVALVTGGAAARFSGFSINPEINYAEGKHVTVSSAHWADGWSPEAAVNGQTASIPGALGWSSGDTQDPNATAAIQVDLGRTYPVGRVDLYPRSDGGSTGAGFPSQYSVWTSLDKTNWTKVDARTNVPRPGAGPQTSTFPTVQARYVQVNGEKLTLVGDSYYFQIAEMAVYGGNLAAGRPVITSSSYESASEGWGAVAATDGSWLSALGAQMGWSSSKDVGVNHTESIAVDLGAPSLIKDVVLYARTDAGNTGKCFPVDFTIEVSNDNAAYTPVVTKTGYPAPDAQPQVFAFTPVTARYVRVRGTSLGTDDFGTYRMQLSEIEVHAG